MQVDGCLDCFCNVGLYDAIFYEFTPHPPTNLGKRSLWFLRHDIIWVWCRFCSQQKSPSYQANLLYNWVPFIFSSERQEYHSLFSTKSICWKSSPESGLKFAAIHIFISFQSFVYLEGKWQNWKETQQQQPDGGFGPTVTWSRWDLDKWEKKPKRTMLMIIGHQWRLFKTKKAVKFCSLFSFSIHKNLQRRNSER